MGNASQINRSRNSVRVERRSDLNESDLGEVYCILFDNIYSLINTLKPQIHKGGSRLFQVYCVSFQFV